MDSAERTVRSGSVIVVSAEDLSQNRNAHKLDTECSVCRNSAWTVFNPKKFCKFCYRCVCKSCSGQTLLHPERHKEERCCSNCFRRFLSQDAIKDANSMKSKHLEARRQAEEELEQVKSLKNIRESDLKNLRESVQLLREELNNEKKTASEQSERSKATICEVKREIAAMESEKASQEVAVSAAEALVKASESSLAVEKSAVVFYSEKVTKAKAELAEAQNEFDRLRCMLNERQVVLSADNFDSKASNSAKIAELQAAISQLREQQSALTVQNEALRREGERKFASAEEEKSDLSDDKQADAKIVAVYYELREQNDRLKREKEQIVASEYREREAERLRREAEKLQTDNDELRALISKQFQSRSKRLR